MKVYRTAQGVLVESGAQSFSLVELDWDALISGDAPRALIESTRPAVHPGPPPRTPDSVGLLPPIGRQEVWAAGVTYYRSRDARMEESQAAGGGDFYDRVYSAERPELFFKSSPHRVAGHGQAVRIRRDSRWNVPEPEWTLVLNAAGKIIGYTIGNDVSSRDIEGENPLYLPQAKVYDRSCALGPGILLADGPLPAETEIYMEIRRGAATAFSGSTRLAAMKRTPTELAEYLFRENRFPDGCFLLTGTGIVPPNEFTLQSGDEVRITIEPIGTLVNRVE